MENPYLIPIIMTLVVAMTLGAIYLLVMLLSDGKSEPAEDDEAHDEEAEEHTGEEPEAKAEADAPAETKH